MGIRKELESFFANAGTRRPITPAEQKGIEKIILDLASTVERSIAEREELLAEISELKKTNRQLLSIIEKQADR